MKQYLAIDIGGTSVKLGIVDEEGRVLAKAEQSVCFDYYETPILTTVLSASEQFLKEQDVRPQSLAGIGVSATGQIDTHTGTVVGTCGSLPNYIGSPIKAELEAKFGLPVTVANDANCMTLGEVWAVSWAITVPMRWTASSAPAVHRAAGSGMPPLRLSCVLRSPAIISGEMAVPSSNRPMRATPSSSPFSRTGRTRSCRALRGWCTSSTRRSSSSAAASALSRSCSSNPSPER